MKLKDIAGKLVINKRNNQVNLSLKKKKIKEKGLDVKDILNWEINTKQILKGEYD